MRQEWPTHARSASREGEKIHQDGHQEHAGSHNEQQELRFWRVSDLARINKKQ